MKNNNHLFIPRGKDICDEFVTHFNQLSMERFGLIYGELEKNTETRSFLGAFACIRDYIVKNNISHTELSNNDVVQIIWESHYARGMQKMRGVLRYPC